MTKIKNNPLLKGASGMLGDVIVYRQLRGEIVMCNRPRKRDELTENQKLRKETFLRAVRYAKKQIADPITKAEYEAGITSKKFNAYTVALTDYLSAPSVDGIDVSRYTGAAGDTIAIKATDDFKVTSVHVAVYSASNELIEEGEAVLQPDTSDDWRYSAGTANATLTGTRVIVTVRDKPGNVTTEEKVL
jgi:hypothetical protein